MATIRDLIREPFPYRARAAKISIVRDGRPTPSLQWVLSCGLNEEGDIYSRFSWLAGCEASEMLYCWPCLLFGSGVGTWRTTGLRLTTNFRKEVWKHQNSPSHLQSSLHYQLFRYKNDLDKKSLVVSAEPPQARDSLGALLRSIKVVLHAVSHQCSVAKKVGKPAPVDSGSCLSTLEFLDSLEVLKAPCGDAIQILRSYDTAVDDIVSAVAKSLRSTIRAEVQQASYVSVVLSGHSQLRHQLVSVVLRYVQDGLVRERFVGLSEVKKGGGVDVVHKLVSQVLEDFDAHEKIVACSVDGDVLSSSDQLEALQARLRDDYPFVRIVPCHLHDLDKVLEQCLSEVEEVRRFFNDLGVLRDSFLNNEKACRVLEGILGFSVPKGLPQGSWRTSQFLIFLSDHRLQFIEYFEALLAGVSSSVTFWEPADLPKALVFLEVLQSIETVFLVHTFVKIFRKISRIRDALQGSSFELAIGSRAAGALKKDLEEERKREAFEVLWNGVRSELLAVDSKDLSMQLALSPEKKPFYWELYRRIHERVSEEVDRRLAPLPELLYFHVFNPDMREQSFVRETRGERGEALCVAETPLDSLLAVHGPCFEQTWVENELQVFFRARANHAGHSAHEVLAFLRSEDLTDILQNLARIAELVLAMPCKPPTADCEGSPKLGEIERWAPLWEDREDLVLLCVEEGFLDELKDRSEFLDGVALECAEAFNLTERGASPLPTNVRDQIQGGPVIVDVRSIE